MSNFQDRLWHELVHAHGADLSRIDRSAARPQPRVRPRLLAGIGLAGIAAAIAAVVAVAVGLGAAGTPPAYAVIRNPDGSVSVSISRLEGIAHANARLAALGVRARAVPVLPACAAAQRALDLARSNRLLSVPTRSVGRLVSRPKGSQVRFYPWRIPVGSTLVLATFPAGRGLHMTVRRWVSGPVPACLRPVPLERLSAPVPPWVPVCTHPLRVLPPSTVLCRPALPLPARSGPRALPSPVRPGTHALAIPVRPGTNTLPTPFPNPADPVCPAPLPIQRTANPPLRPPISGCPATVPVGTPAR